ncbi:Hypothetical predicted protein [Olea europaea subsp. europaea]|uniref:Uncharacterized protein n=1 Tax=Olea europaea subsp. europaea TaxID=158383 RepID=A0A8S0SA64_OLEEU
MEIAARDGMPEEPNNKHRANFTTTTNQTPKVRSKKIKEPNEDNGWETGCRKNQARVYSNARKNRAIAPRHYLLEMKMTTRNGMSTVVMCEI